MSWNVTPETGVGGTRQCRWQRGDKLWSPSEGRAGIWEIGVHTCPALCMVPKGFFCLLPSPPCPICCQGGGQERGEGAVAEAANLLLGGRRGGA